MKQKNLKHKHRWTPWKAARVEWYTEADGAVFGSIPLRVCWGCLKVEVRKTKGE